MWEESNGGDSLNYKLALTILFLSKPVRTEDSTVMLCLCD